MEGPCLTSPAAPSASSGACWHRRPRPTPDGRAATPASPPPWKAPPRWRPSRPRWEASGGTAWRRPPASPWAGSAPPPWSPAPTWRRLPSRSPRRPAGECRWWFTDGRHGASRPPTAVTTATTPSPPPGALQLFAANAQEAVDFSLIARRVAEEALLPAVVAMDVETALGVEDLLLPSPALLARFLGDPGDTVHPATPAQETLFGRHRRRVPRRHDPERPLRTGGAAGPGGLRPRRRRPPRLRRAAARRHAGRRLRRLRRGDRPASTPPLSAHQLKGARVVLLAQGAAVETAEAVADALRRDRRQGRGGGAARAPPVPRRRAGRGAPRRPRRRRPRADRRSAGERAAAARRGAGALARARENQQAGREVHPGLPALAEREMPRLTSVLYGLGGSPLRAADLAALRPRAGGRPRQKGRGAGRAPPSSGAGPARSPRRSTSAWRCRPRPAPTRSARPPSTTSAGATRRGPGSASAPTAPAPERPAGHLDAHRPPPCGSGRRRARRRRGSAPLPRRRRPPPQPRATSPPPGGRRASIACVHGQERGARPRRRRRRRLRALAPAGAAGRRRRAGPPRRPATGRRAAGRSRRATTPTI